MGAHAPVLLAEFLEAADPREGELWVDGTFGRGGHSTALLERGARVLAIDRDEEAQKAAAGFLPRYPRHFTFIHDTYEHLEHHLHDHGWPLVNGILLDLGVSSPQLDNPERGFSFRADGPLDMRMDRSQPLTAADLVNQRSERDLADLFYRLGDENRSRAIARAVARRREKQPIRTTMELAEVVAAAVGRRTPGGLHPATKVFQALRIAVNHELDALAATLPMAARLIIPGGRLAVISFHSGEDRITKEFFRKHASLWLDTPEHPQSFRNPECLFQPARRFLPSAAEIEKNPRARSARLRVACRNDNPSRTSNPNPKLHRP